MPDVPRETSATVSDTPARVDLSDWLTKAQAAEAIGVTPKTIERLAQAGKLEQRSRPQARGPNVAVYFPDDVTKLAQERQPGAKPFVLPADPDSSAGSNGRHTGGAMIPSPSPVLATRVGDDPVRAFAAAVYAAVMSQTSETAAAPPTLFLSIDEAAAVSGLSRTCLRRLIRNQKLPAFRDRGWRIRRRDLEQL
jgi:excisionase family DNA binding protein